MRAIKKNLFSSVFSLICMIAVLTTVLNILGNTLLRNQIKRIGLREQNVYIDAYIVYFGGVVIPRGNKAL